MERETKFVDVIIPIAIPNLLTYRIPHSMSEFIRVGQRVVVQLGRSKMYTAIVNEVHARVPQKYEAKYIESILDESPIVTSTQLAFWKWMASYYMCTLGEVASTALPSSLKLASETKILLQEHYRELDDSILTDKEFLILEGLEIHGEMNLVEIAELLDQKAVMPLIKSMIDKRFVITVEDLKLRYKPKTAEFVYLHPSLHNEEKLQEAFSQIENRAPKQLEMLLAYLREDPDYQLGVSKVKLQKMVNGDAQLSKKLVEKEVFEIRVREIGRLSEYQLELEKDKELSEDQERALKEIKQSFEKKDVCLLYGVTGSGKTEVYVSLIRETLERGEEVLYLIPEIALTTQLIKRLQKYFGNQVGVFHSKFNVQERAEIWLNTLKSGDSQSKLIVGARSSLFLPFNKLGLIIIDEEHENSFKQYDPAPRYHARDSSVVLAKMHGAKVLMGSATPSIESFWNAEKDRYGIVEMSSRYGNILLPEVQCADIRSELKRKTMKNHFTSFLLEQMDETLKKGQQIILFQNRRGYSPLWQCSTCGWVPHCTRCDVSLTYHKRVHHLNCHYCGYTIEPPKTCEVCGNHDLKLLGFGTEKIEEELALHFPDAKAARMDLDTTRSKHAYQEIIGAFEEKEIDILVGTQMVTKGLDFEHVGLVGILNADLLLNFPDFRSFERAFQLMTQVAGRAGRKHERGKVVVQTYTPDHWVIRKVMDHDFESLYKQELIERLNFQYPPFFRLIKLTLKHKDEKIVRASSIDLGQALRLKLEERVIGPETPYIGRINNQYLRNIMIKIERNTSPATVKDYIKACIAQLVSHPDYKALRVVLDVDPV
jgi:primosomal protein N' (replication factor Y) (superfamily II helicase)